MSELLQRLGDAAKSGVYRTSHGDDILDALRGSNVALAHVEVTGAAGKEALLARIAKALSFPEWFGGNWDALEESLADLAWSGTRGCVVLFEGAEALPEADRAELCEVLAAAAQTWKERQRPFFAVFVKGSPALPELTKGGK
jgi:hypothetical protein